MRIARFQWCGAATAAILALLVAAPAKAADETGAKTVAGEPGQRMRLAAAPEGQQKGGLSDSAVRVLMTYAFSVIPDEQPGSDGKPVKTDKSEPAKFIIPDEAARGIIRAATRSAYAEACELPDLAQANYQALMRSEGAKRVWTEQQLLMVNALYLFSASYFAGNVNITETPATDPGANAGAAAGAASPPKEAQPAPGPETNLITPKRPQCPPEQKQKVMAAINAYVQSIPAGPAPAPAPAPAQPASSSAN
jgi:hypothetical protein